VLEYSYHNKISFQIMGNSGSSAAGALGAKSTAKQVIEKFGSDDYLKGTTAIVTGGNSGIGVETCKALLFAGARVILCSRSVAAGQKAVNEEIAKPGHGGYTVDTKNVVVKELDLNSLKSVKKFCDEVLAEESHIDLLICNAGIMALPTREETVDGFEKQIGVNLHGHFYMTQLLLPMMKAQAPKPARVVVLSSTAHNMGNVDPSDLHFNKGRTYAGWVSYGQSKQADLIFARELAKKTKGTNVTSVSVHPGVIATNLWRSTSPIMTAIVSAFVMDKDIPQGASTTIYAAVAPEMQKDENRGVYLSDCAVAQPTCECARDVDGKIGAAMWDVVEADINRVVKSW
jgi:NAD(P)-dependent dehydrogenase (short-subunit alcohol dehydrogenase family)